MMCRGSPGCVAIGGSFLVGQAACLPGGRGKQAACPTTLTGSRRRRRCRGCLVRLIPQLSLGEGHEDPAAARTDALVMLDLWVGNLVLEAELLLDGNEVLDVHP